MGKAIHHLILLREFWIRHLHFRAFVVFHSYYEHRSRLSSNLKPPQCLSFRFSFSIVELIPELKFWVIIFHYWLVSLNLMTDVDLVQARRRSLQDNFSVHGNAKLDPSRASCNPVPWRQSGCSTSLLRGRHGYHGP